MTLTRCPLNRVTIIHRLFSPPARRRGRAQGTKAVGPAPETLLSRIKYAYRVSKITLGRTRPSSFTMEQPIGFAPRLYALHASPNALCQPPANPSHMLIQPFVSDALPSLTRSSFVIMAEFVSCLTSMSTNSPSRIPFRCSQICEPRGFFQIPDAESVARLKAEYSLLVSNHVRIAADAERLGSHTSALASIVNLSLITTKLTGRYGAPAE